MKKAVFALVLALFLFSAGCQSPKTDAVQTEATTVAAVSEYTQEAQTVSTDAPADGFSFDTLENLEFCFASGAGGWRTVIQIQPDGSFSGTFSDSEMGSVGEGYPKGTYYVCKFNGTFTDPIRINDYTYSIGIREIRYSSEPDTSEIIDGILYCYTAPYGLESAEELLLYLPGSPTTELSQEYMQWVRSSMENADADTLPFFGLYNAAEQLGFSSYEISDPLNAYLASVEAQSDSIKHSLSQDFLTQPEMNQKSQELYTLWDDALNDLWSELKRVLPENEFAELLNEQRAWITEKEAAVAEAGKAYAGGSIYPLIVNGEAAAITEKRVYELYEILK